MTPDEKHAYARSFPVHVGVDTAKQFHALVAQGPDGRRSKPFKVLVSRAGFEATDAHTFKVALRGANLCSESLQDKQRARSVIEGVYKVRSAMVHSGEWPSEVKLGGFESLGTYQLMEEALRITSALIRRILADNALPDWSLKDLASL